MWPPLPQGNSARRARPNIHEFRPVAYPPITLWFYARLSGLLYPTVLAIHSTVSLSALLIAVAIDLHSGGAR